MIGQCCNFHGINSTVEKHEIFFRILAAYLILSIMWQYTSIHMITLDCPVLFCIVFENITVSIVDLMVLHEITFFTDEAMFPLFTHLSADYRLRHLVNNVTIHIYTHDYIRMKITVLYLKISRHQLWI